MRARTVILVLGALAVLVFGIRNLPWHLDDYDQAKQAYAAVDVVEHGSLVLQELPLGGVATKPPLMAWLQAGTYYLSAGSWPIAWRLPSLAAAIILLVLIGHWGWTRWRGYGCCLGIAAFSFNMLSIRIATLVRTDMLLALFCFIPGLMIMEHVVGKGRLWTARERIWFGVAVLAALATKGPVLCAMLLPGMGLYWLVSKIRKERSSVWPGWLAFVVPLLILVGTIVWVVLRTPEYYEQIVVGEIFSLFNAGTSSTRSQPFYYYVAHLFHKWAPWSLLLSILLVAQGRKLREFWRCDPEFVWLVCWAAGGMLAMSLVPQKRVDRIYPMVPVLCLLLVYLASRYQPERLFGIRFTRLISCFIGVGAFAWTAYAAVEVFANYEDRVNRIKEFACSVEQDDTGVIVTESAAEGFMCYVRGSRCMSDEEAVAVWKIGEADTVILSEASYQKAQSEMQDAAVSGSVSDPFNDTTYLLLRRVKPDGR